MFSLTPKQTFTGGARGIVLQNQQYIFKNLVFNNCNVGIFISSVFIATFQGISFSGCNFGVDMARIGSAGAVSLVDSSVSQCQAAVNAFVGGTGEGSLVIDHLDVVNVSLPLSGREASVWTRANKILSQSTAVQASNGTTILAGPVPRGKSWVLGNRSVLQSLAELVYLESVHCLTRNLGIWMVTRLVRSLQSPGQRAWSPGTESTSRCRFPSSRSTTPARSSM